MHPDLVYSNMKLYLRWLLKLAITILVLFYLLATKKLDLSSTLLVLEKVEIVGPVFLLLLTVVVLGALRWRLLLRSSGAAVSLGDILRLTLIGNFFNFTVPGGVGGDLAKTYYVIRRDGIQSAAAISSVVVDRFVGTSVLVGIGVLSLSLSHFGQELQGEALKNFWQTLLLGYAAGVPLLWWALTRSKNKTGTNLFLRLPGNWGMRLMGIRDAMLNFRHFKAAVLLTVLYSLGIHGCVITAFWVLGQAFAGPHVHLLQYAALVPLGLLTMALPIAPAGVGVSHLAFFTLFASVGFQQGADLFSLFLVCQLVMALPGLLFYLLIRDRKKNI